MRIGNFGLDSLDIAPYGPNGCAGVWIGHLRAKLCGFEAKTSCLFDPDSFIVFSLAFSFIFGCFQVFNMFKNLIHILSNLFFGKT